MLAVWIVFERDEAREKSINVLAMTLTSFRFSWGPFLRVMVTGPELPDHVRVKGFPAWTL